MTKQTQSILGAALAISVVALILWQGTGGDYYTKFQVVEEIEKQVDANDPLAAAGFYDDDNRTETVVRDEFRFGLLPTPNSLLDKHLLSVASTISPAWIAALGIIWWLRRRERKAHSRA